MTAAYLPHDDPDDPDTLGPQRGPSSVGKVEAESRAVNREILDLLRMFVEGHASISAPGWGKVNLEVPTETFEAAIKLLHEVLPSDGPS